MERLEKVSFSIVLKARLIEFPSRGKNKFDSKFNVIITSRTNEKVIGTSRKKEALILAIILIDLLENK